ncbi:protease complex subunit PrcB family protein [uncultured Flavobacterium sp.]|uniref:protease complex subunit PrcB family protein n=1 Tax=uncultured Flavobacterium sp. TaxID=165435 RepID=UPI00292F52BE|nr:protease complex subunit PrcB family protein [uncultured Flavobacterium sp.]
MMKKLILSLFIAFGFSACSLSNDDNTNVDCGSYTDLSFTGYPLLCNYGLITNPTNPVAIVANSQEKMDQYFKKHDKTCPNSSDPTIDFTKNFLVGIFSGLKSTSGYTIKMTSIIENKCQLVINFYEKAPLPGETISTAATYPSDFILIPKTSKPIVFNKTTESPDNIVIGTFNSKCTGADCQNFFQINDFNILKFQNVVAGGYDFNQYRYIATTKRGDYTALLKTVPSEILSIQGQTKTYGTPDSSDQGGVYFELRQGIKVTKIYIDNNDTNDQGTEIKLFKKAIKDKIASLK